MGPMEPKPAATSPSPATGPGQGATQDAWAPAEIAARVEVAGVGKARADTLSVLVLAVLAGAFISLGAIFFVVVVSGSELGFGPTRMLGGLAFSLGLILVVVAGAELFTGNNLVAMAWASGDIRLRELLRNWGLVWLGEVDALGGGAVGETALAIGHVKAGYGVLRCLALGVLCNALVCLAVWLAIGGRSVTDKVLGILFPITAFVTVGFEHSIANWFFLPYAHLLGAGETAGYVPGALRNLLAVSVGNVVGGTLLVAGVYWLAYLRPGKSG